jgi:nitrite reductase/ring-hydroxylating ferredoxin subunit
MIMAPEWIKACEVKELNNSELVGFDFNEKKILISKIRKKVYATDRICTHAYADLSTGFMNEEEETITCPLHLSSFKLEDGTPQNLPAEVPLKTYKTKIQDNSVYILVE